jgi:hypothetical protein
MIILQIRVNLVACYRIMGDAAIAKGMAGSRKYCCIFEPPQWRGINCRISED